MLLEAATIPSSPSATSAGVPAALPVVGCMPSPPEKRCDWTHPLIITVRAAADGCQSGERAPLLGEANMGARWSPVLPRARATSWRGYAADPRALGPWRLRER